MNPSNLDKIPSKIVDGFDEELINAPFRFNEEQEWIGVHFNLQRLLVQWYSEKDYDSIRNFDIELYDAISSKNLMAIWEITKNAEKKGTITASDKRAIYEILIKRIEPMVDSSEEKLDKSQVQAGVENFLNGEIINNVSIENNMNPKPKPEGIVIDTTAEVVPNNIEVKHLGSDEEIANMLTPEAIKTKSLLSKDAKEYLELVAGWRENEGKKPIASSIRSLIYDIEDDVSIEEIVSKINSAELNDLLNKIEKEKVLSFLGVNVEKEQSKVETEYGVGDSVYWRTGSTNRGPYVVRDIDTKEGLVYLDDSKVPRLMSDIVIYPENAESITEEDIENCYNDINNIIGNVAFSLSDYVDAKGGDWSKLSLKDKDFLTSIFNELVKRGQITKFGKKYLITSKNNGKELNKKLENQNENKEIKLTINGHDYKAGDEVFIDGEKKYIKSIDENWVEIVDGPIIAVSEFKEKLAIPNEDVEKIDITEEDIEGCYNDLQNVMGDNHFLLSDYVQKKGGDWNKISKNEKLFLINIFGILVSRGKLVKDINGYAISKNEKIENVNANPAKVENIPENKSVVELHENKEIVSFGFDELKNIVSELVGNKAKITTLDFIPSGNSVKINAELDAGFLGGKIKFSGNVANASNGIIIVDVKVEARAPVKSMIESNIANLDVAITNYFEQQKGKKVLNIQIDGPRLVVEFEGNKVTDKKVENVPVVGRVVESTPAVEATADNTVPQQVESMVSNNIAEDLKLNLKNAQLKYAEAQVNYKKKQQENHRFMTKIRSSLGLEETTAEVLGKITPKNLEEEVKKLGEAQEEYIVAKKARIAEIIALPVTPEEITRHGLEGLPNEKIAGAVYKMRRMEYSESEWDSLQRKIMELTPTKEKGEMMKWFGKWTNSPLVVRLTALPILIGVGIAVAPGLGFAAGGIAAGGAYAGVRLARGVGGYVGSKYAGRGLDSLANKINTKIRNENAEYYTENVNADNFEKYEKIDMQNREKEANIKQQQRVAKAVAMVAAGAGAGIATGFAESTFSNMVMPGAGHVSVVETPVTKPSTGFWHDLKTKIIPDKTSTPKASTVPENTNLKSSTLKADALKVKSAPEFAPAKVELSSKGFIQTFDDLKKQLASQYEGKTMPKGVKEFIDKPSAKLAQDYGFYDAKKGLSGMGLKGEHLTIDNKGNVSLEHLDGKSEVIDTTDHKFHGKMLDTNPPKAPVAPLEAEKVPVHGGEINGPEGIKVVPVESDVSKYHIVDSTETTKVPLESVPVAPKVPATLNNFDIVSNNKTYHVEVSEIAGTKQIMVDHVKIAEQVPGVKVGNGTMIKLLDKYQDGKKFAPIREAYTKVIDQNIPLTKENILPINFENGRIHVIKNVVDGKTNASVLLNGKEIARGYLENKSSSLKLIKGIPKGGILFPDTVYERALKTAERVIKVMDNNNLAKK